MPPKRHESILPRGPQFERKPIPNHPPRISEEELQKYWALKAFLAKP
jgi:hypothetical protein